MSSIHGERSLLQRSIWSFIIEMVLKTMILDEMIKRGNIDRPVLVIEIWTVRGPWEEEGTIKTEKELPVR